MKFKDKFKKGDIIRRGSRLGGKLMIVESFKDVEVTGSVWNFEPAYICQDLFKDDQKWRAYEKGNFELATDEDIINSLSFRIESVDIFHDSFGDVLSEANDQHITLFQDDRTIFLDPETALSLAHFINKYVEKS